MIETELEALGRAHQMFAGAAWPPVLDAGTEPSQRAAGRAAGLNSRR